MHLPFSKDAFLDVFAAYNTALWPGVAALWIVTLAAWIQFVRGRLDSRALAGLLALHWAWSGIVYHGLFFTRINPAARLFAALFVLQAALFVWLGVVRRRLAFDAGRAPRHVLGGVLIVYALAYPGLVLLAGHRWPRAPMFAVPCPSTLITSGFLLGAVTPPRWLAAIPVAWCVVGGSAAGLLSMTPDLMLFVAAALMVTYAVRPGTLARRSEA